MTDEDNVSAGDPHDAGQARIAKVIARAGLASRRDAEAWIAAGRVTVNGQVITSPALNVGPRDRVTVDGEPLPGRERTRLWLYHKPRGLVTTAKDPEGRTTVFDVLPPELPRVVSVGRLDLNTEGLLLLTNDGGLARVLAHPSTAWLRRYRVRAFGKIEIPQLEALAKGIEIEGFSYGPIEASLDRQQGDNAWLTLGLREGKNREVRKVLEHLGMSVNRLIRLSFGPFQLGELAEGAVEEIRTRYLRDQLGGLAEEAGCDFDAPIVDRTPEPEKRVRQQRALKADKPRTRAGLTQDRKGRRVLVERLATEKPKREERSRPRRAREDRPERDARAGKRFEQRPDRGEGRRDDRRPERDTRPGRSDDRRPRRDGDRPAFRRKDERDGARGDKRERKDEPRPYGNRALAFRARPSREDRSDRGERRGPPRDRSEAPRRDRDDRPRGKFGDKPRGNFGERPRGKFGDKPRGDGPRDGGGRGGPRGDGKPRGRPGNGGPPRGRPGGGRPGGGRPRSPR